MTNTNDLRIPASFPPEDYAELQRRFAQLPEVTLPDSLTAESLWSRLDAEKTQATPKRGGVVQLLHRYRPILSYAAVFVLMVAVYYGAGLDSPGPGALSSMEAPAPAAAPRMAMDAAPESSSAMDVAPEMAAAPEATPEATPEAVKPQLMMANSPPANDAAKPDRGNGQSATVDFTSFAKNLQLIPLEPGEKLSFNLSEADNMIFINISTTGEQRLRAEIAKLMEECAIPGEKVSISAVAP